MQIQKVSFTSVPQKTQNQQTETNSQSSLYSKQNFIQMGAINDFIACSAVGFGVLESRDKFKLLKKEKVLPAALKEMAKKHTKRNILLGLGIGALYTAVDVTLIKIFCPKIEKIYDKLDKMNG